MNKVEVEQCAWGKLSATAVKLSINNGFRVARPILNKVLNAHPIDFPKEALGIFELQSMNLAYFDDYVYAGITPVFIGPKKAEFVSEPELNCEFGSDFIRTEEFIASEDGETDDLIINYTEVCNEEEFQVQF